MDLCAPLANIGRRGLFIDRIGTASRSVRLSDLSTTTPLHSGDGVSPLQSVVAPLALGHLSVMAIDKRGVAALVNGSRTGGSLSYRLVVTPQNSASHGRTEWTVTGRAAGSGRCLYWRGQSWPWHRPRSDASGGQLRCARPSAIRISRESA